MSRVVRKPAGRPAGSKTAPKKRGAARRIPKGALCLTALGVLTVWALAELYFSNFVPEVTREEVRLSALPPGFDGYKVAHLSDLHETSFGSDGLLLFTLLEREQPDLIAVTGDMLDSTDALDWASDVMLRLTSIAPTYYVTGNHEWSADWLANLEDAPRLTPLLRKIIEAAGAVWLDYGHTVLERGGDSILLVGLTDPNGPRDHLDYEEQLEKIRRREGDLFTLTLSHRYDMLDTYVELGLDLVLSGHAHGGLIRPPFTDGLVGPSRVLFPKHTSGITVSGGTTMAVNRGLGCINVPRVWNRPDITILTLISERGSGS